jgi:hypothetical protein
VGGFERAVAHALAAARWAGREGNPAGLICLKLKDYLTTKSTKAERKYLLGSSGQALGRFTGILEVAFGRSIAVWRTSLQDAGANSWGSVFVSK